MENNKEYKALKTFKAQLEAQLSDLAQLKHRDLYQQRRAVEDQFERLAHALEARKLVLLDSIDQILVKQELHFKQVRKDLNTAIQACSKHLMAGAAAFEFNRLSGELIWKEALSCTYVPAVDKSKLVPMQIYMPSQLLHDIYTHGAVQIESRSAIPTPTSPFSVPSATPSPCSPISSQNTIPENNILAPPLLVPPSLAPPLVVPPLLAPPLLVPHRLGNVTTLVALSGSNMFVGCCYNPIDECLYVCNNNLINRVTLDGTVTIFAAVKKEEFKYLHSITMNHKERVFYCTYGGEILRIDRYGRVEYRPFNLIPQNNHYIVVDQISGNLLVADNSISGIKALTPQGKLSTFAECGSPKLAGMCFDGNSLLVCDNGNNAILRVTTTGKVSTVCKLDSPICVDITPDGDLFITSLATRTITLAVLQPATGEYKMYSMQKFEQTAGTVGIGFLGPRGIVYHQASGAVYVCDRRRILKISVV